jgi:molybdopterin-guanine dinucleotide biosynthesis protein A
MTAIAGVVLAGGRSSRMAGAAKATLELAGVSLVELVVARLRPQVSEVVVNFNGDPASLPRMPGVAVVADPVAGHPGPLAGVVCAFDYLDLNRSPAEAVAVVPCDGPFLPATLVATLAEALVANAAQAACVRYLGQLQPTFSLWRRDCAPLARGELDRGRGGFKSLLAELAAVVVDWPQGEFDPFFNINTPAELAAAQRLVAARRH